MDPILAEILVGDPVIYAFFICNAFVFGALLGSFFNVCIYRIPRGVPLAFPASHCYRCGQLIRWYDNIPLFSYWILGGRCRVCSSPYSIRYFFIELLTALLFTAVFVRYSNPALGFSFVFVPGVIFVSLLLIASFTDIDHWIIPDRISLGGLGAGIVLAAIWPLGLEPHNPLSVPILDIGIPEKILPLVNALSGAAAGAGVIWTVGFIGKLAFRKEAMGMGDVKLMAMFGAFLGPINATLVLFLASFFGAALGIAAIVGSAVRRKKGFHPSVEPLQANPFRLDDLSNRYDLLTAELYVVGKALNEPGSIGATRHLPFGPSLALAAFAFFMAWEPIQSWLLSNILMAP